MFARLAVGEVSPMLLVALRWFGTVLLLGVLCRETLAEDWEKLRARLPLLFMMGALGFSGFNVLFYTAAHTTTAVNIGIIQGAMPAFILLGAFLVHRAPVTTLRIAGVIVTIAGVFLVATRGDLSLLAEFALVQGDFLMIVACLLYAGYAICLRQFSQIVPLNLLLVLAVAALIASLPLAWLEFTGGELVWPSTKGWTIVGLIILLPSFTAQVCFIKGVAAIGAGRAGVFVNLVPVFSALLAVMVLDESFRLYHTVSLGLVLGGIWLSERYE